MTRRPPMSVAIHARTGNRIGAGNWVRSSHLFRELSRRGHRARLEAFPDGSEARPSLPESLGAASPGTIDVQVIDDPMDAISLCQPASSRVALDFFGSPDPHFRTVINVIDPTPPTVLAASAARRLVGLKYVILEPDAGTTEQMREGAKSCLVVLGGKDSRRASLPLIRALGPVLARSPFERLTVILRDDHEDRDPIRAALQGSRLAFTILPTQPSLLPLIRSSHLVFCNGGLTSALVALQKRPAVFLPQTPLEEEFLGLMQVNRRQILLAPDVEERPRLSEALDWALGHQAPGVAGMDGAGCQRVADAVEQAFR